MVWFLLPKLAVLTTQTGGSYYPNWRFLPAKASSPTLLKTSFGWVFYSLLGINWIHHRICTYMIAKYPHLKDSLPRLLPGHFRNLVPAPTSYPELLKFKYLQPDPTQGIIGKCILSKTQLIPFSTKLIPASAQYGQGQGFVVSRICTLHISCLLHFPHSPSTFATSIWSFLSMRRQSYECNLLAIRALGEINQAW